MSFIFSRSKPFNEAVAAAQPAPVQIARSTEPTGDVVAQAEKDKQRRRGGAGQRRGLATVLTGEQTVFGATAGKTLLGA